jgi:hypothetical protein
VVGLVPWHGAGWAVPLAGTAIASALCKVVASIGTISTSASRREVLFIAALCPGDLHAQFFRQALPDLLR